jgi:hypothetical protein
MRRLIQLAFLIPVLLFAAHIADAAELHVPTDAIAGVEVTIPTSGSGDATFYLFGPGTAIKRAVKLGEDIRLAGNDLQFSGRYTAVLSAAGNNDSGVFFVTPSKPADIAFLARPSRVPASTHKVISGTAFVFDTNHNLVTRPTPVDFSLGVPGGRAETRTTSAKDGVAYLILDSGRQAGAAQFTASLSDDNVRRVVQVTASDPCNLRMRAQPAKNGIAVETDTIRDCAGNPVPDGTIVTFTEVDSTGRSTVDARIKKGIAQALLPQSNSAQLAVASGVVVGNEIHWSGH